jgi:hypothetical protein
MNFRLTMTLTIILLLVVSGWLFLSNQARKPQTPAGPTPLLAVAPREINRITYIRDGREEVAFTRNGEEWQMTTPVKAPVDKWQIQGVADDLKALNYHRKFEPEPAGDRSANATGIERPRNVIKFTDDTHRETTLAFGKSTIDGVYATLNGAKTIYLLDKNPVTTLQQEPDRFRNKTIKEIDINKITALTVKTGQDTVSLGKTGEKWLVTAPISARANDATVNEVLNEFRAIRANAFSTLNKQTAGLAQPIVSVTAYVNDAPATTAPATNVAAATQPAGTPVTLQIGLYTDLIKKNFVYAGLAGSEEVFTLRAEAFTKLNRELKDLRDPAVTPAPVASATEFTVTIPPAPPASGQPTLTASKKDGKWALTAPVAVDGDTFAIGDYLGVLRDLRAIRFVDNAGNLSSIGLDPPLTRIELTIPNQSQREVILIGNTETDDTGGKVTPFMRQGEPTVYLVQAAEADRLVANPMLFRDKTVASLEADHLRAIEVSGPGASGGGFTLERDGTVWKVATGSAAAGNAQETKVSALLGGLTPLTAVKYLEAVPPTITPAVTVTVKMLEPTIAPATAPATQGAIPAATPLGPDPGKITTHTLKLYRQDPPATAPGATTTAAPTWKAYYDGQSPAWTFEPSATLVDHLTKETYAVPATQPATAPAVAPAARPGQP